MYQMSGQHITQGLKFRLKCISDFRLANIYCVLTMSKTSYTVSIVAIVLSHTLCVCACECEHAQSCLTLCNPMDCNLPGLLSQWDFPSNTGMGCHFLLQGIYSLELSITQF